MSEINETQNSTFIDEMGIVAKGTKIHGDISTRGHLTIYGEVEGNISAKGNILAAGTIIGDISCDNIRFSNCKVKTNLNVLNTISIDENVHVEGQIKCERISIDGIIKGDIEARQEVSIFQNAQVVGNISTRAIGVESGAKLNGNIMVRG